MGKLKQYKGDYKECLKEANEFMKVVEWLSEDIPFIDKYSFAVNLTLACELYIKALQIYYDKDGKFYSGHELNVLYSKLPKKVKQRVYYKYRKQLPKERWMSIGRLLETHSEIFINWRYSFQRGSPKSTLYYSEFIVFVRALQQEAKKCV